jgi:sugar phosphate isomerase/epimerase
MFQKLGLQLYTVRDYMKTAEEADACFARLAELGYTEAHTAGCAFDEAKFVELLHKHGISIVGTHYDYPKIINNYEETMELHRLWGTTNIGIGGMPKEARTSLDGLKTFIRDYNRAAQEYAKHGFKLTYHNHHFEFLRIDGYKTLMDYLYEGLDPATTSFVLDTCWVAAGGGDVTAWMEKLAGRIDILHLKDLWFKTNDTTGAYESTMTEVGHGNLSWDKIIKTAEQIGVKHYVVEQDKNFMETPFESLKSSAQFLKQYQK